MLDGKRGKAATILYAAFIIVREQTGQDPMEISNKQSKTSYFIVRS